MNSQKSDYQGDNPFAKAILTLTYPQRGSIVNLAFDLRKHKGVRDDILFESFKPVSLWDMLRIRAQDFIDASAALAVSTIIEKLKKSDPDRKRADPPPIRDELIKLRSATIRMRLKVVVDRTDELIEYISSNEEIDLSRLEEMVKVLPGKLMKELKGELWLERTPER